MANGNSKWGDAPVNAVMPITGGIDATLRHNLATPACTRAKKDLLAACTACKF